VGKEALEKHEECNLSCVPAAVTSHLSWCRASWYRARETRHAGRPSCIWQSPEALEEYRSSGMPGGVQMFRSVGAEATEEEFDVAHQML
jgi:hypothetical protein